MTTDVSHEGWLERKASSDESDVVTKTFFVGQLW